MIRFLKGDIFKSEAEALVNSVNTVGVMGKGIALQFKERFPENYRLYKKACQNGEVTIGKMFVTHTNSLVNPKWIINFPTKKHWMHRSSYSYIEKGLDDLVRVIKELNIKSIAIPPLGAGQGGLKWEKVKEIIENKLQLLDIDIEVYEPGCWPEKGQNKNAVLTKPRALILFLIDKYRVLGFDATVLEIQKLAYFLQRLGQKDLNLNFRKYYYGPYAHNLQHLLRHLENSFLITDKPIMDSKPYDTIYLNKARLKDIKAFIEKNCTDKEIARIETVEQIINGFESPFGLELLATVDWIISNNGARTPEKIKQAIYAWSKKKSERFKTEHINIALEHLYKFKEKLGYA